MNNGKGKFENKLDKVAGAIVDAPFKVAKRVKKRVKIVGSTKFTPKRRKFTPGGLFDV